MGVAPLLLRLIEQLRLSSRVVFTGLLEGRTRLEALADADVVAYASTDEVFGLVPLEALLSGTPVVVANDSGCGEMIGHIGGGLTVIPGDPQALAEALGMILDRPNDWRSAARSAAHRVRSLCDPDAIAKQLEAVYLEVVAH
jgi:glycosyltransferase involved in cell wall biosynthesis